MSARPAIAFRAAALCAAVLLAACGKTPGWSPADRQNARELCLTQVGESFELGKAQAYCGCVVAKTMEQFPSYTEADKLSTGKDGERLGNECADELRLTGHDAPASGSAAAGAGSAAGGQPVAAESRIYGDWQVVFVAADPSADEVDTWQAVSSDTSGGSLLAYVCEPGAGCGFLLRPELPCDSGNGQNASFTLLFAQDNARSSLQVEAHCLPNGAWAFDSPDPILEQLRDLPDTVKISLRGAALDFSLDGATGALAYAEKAGTDRGAGAQTEPSPAPGR
jgi:hypothetical protein